MYYIFNINSTLWILTVATNHEFVSWIFFGTLYINELLGPIVFFAGEQ